MSTRSVQDYFTREDLPDYYRFMKELFQSDDSLEEMVSMALKGLTYQGLLEKVNDNEYRLVRGELLDTISELRKLNTVIIH